MPVIHPKRIGITGNIGSGKSTVAKLFAAKGAALIDSDQLARNASEDPEILAQIQKQLDPSLVENGILNRSKTAALVFNNEAARHILNSIIHPWVRRKTIETYMAMSETPTPPPVVLMDIPLLYENNLESTLDKVIVVTAPLNLRIERVESRNGFTAEDIRARDAAQLPLIEKEKRADFVIHNDGTLESLKAQVDAIWPCLL